MRLLVVEDEAPLREGLAEDLRRRGYSVDVAADGRTGAFMGREYPFDAAVIDLGLPDLSGMEVIRTLRRAGRSFPILILTARDRWQDKVEGLEAGGDDYLVKPFHIEELSARLNALIRRAAGFSQPVVHSGPYELDTRAQRIRVQGSDVDLTGYEYRIAEYFILHPGKVVSKTELSEHLYEQDFDRDSNVLEVLIARLRRKLDPAGGLQPIETLRGRGYRWGITGEGAG